MFSNHIYSNSFYHHTNSHSMYDEIYKKKKNRPSFNYDKLRVVERCTRKWKFSESAVLSCTKIVEDFRFLLNAEAYNLILRSFETFDLDMKENGSLNASEPCMKYPNESQFFDYLQSKNIKVRPGTILKKMFIQDQQCVEKQTWEKRAAVFRQTYTR